MAFYIKKPTTNVVPNDNNWKFTYYTGSGWSETISDKKTYDSATEPNNLCSTTDDSASDFCGATVVEE